MKSLVETQTMRKVGFHLMPLLLLSYVLAYIGRVNVGFAALTMNADLGLTAYEYGIGAGLFFWGYFFFEVPSNLILEKVGARRWIFRIMITWGLLSMGMAFIQGQTSFLVLRFILGVAEAGFFPGVILYLTYWAPSAYRARTIAIFMVSIPASLALGSPISTALLEMNGIWGLKGWQWMFMLEGLPTVLLSFVILTMLPDRPRHARWLTDDEKQWLEKTISDETKVVEKAHGMALWRIFVDLRVFGLAFVYFANTTTNLGLAFFLPQIVKGLGLNLMQTGFASSVPFIFGTFGILVLGYISDKYKERRFCLFGALVLSGIGFIGAGMAGGSSFTSLVFISLAAIGVYSAKAPFWPLPAMFLTGSAAAGGIALINSIGNLGGFVGPYIFGLAKQTTNSFAAGLYAMAGLAIAAAVVEIIIVKKGSQLMGTKKAPAPEPESAK
jgi:MFS family permease